MANVLLFSDAGEQITQEQEIITWHVLWMLCLSIPDGSHLSFTSRINLIHLTIT